MPPVLDPDEHEKKLFTVKEYEEDALKNGEDRDKLIYSNFVHNIGPDNTSFKFSTLINSPDCYGKVIIENFDTKAVGTVMFDILGSETSVQIKSVFVEEFYQGNGLALEAYKSLLESYIIISDNTQTSCGAGFWNEKLSDDPSLNVHIIENFDGNDSNLELKKDSAGSPIIYTTDLNEELGPYIWGVDASDFTEYPHIAHSRKKTNESTVLQVVKK